MNFTPFYDLHLDYSALPDNVLDSTSGDEFRRREINSLSIYSRGSSGAVEFNTLGN